MLDIIRKPKELIARYKLEKDLKDIYVEGNLDKEFIRHFLDINKIDKTVVYDVATIDLSEFHTEQPELKSNKKRQVLKVAEVLSTEFKQAQIKVKGIVDLDLDPFLGITNQSHILLCTDYSSIEGYLYNEDVIGKIVKFGYPNFPVTVDRIIEEFSKLLKFLFIIRYLRETHDDSSAKLLPIDTAFNVKKDGIISFDVKDYVKRYCEKNGISKKKASYEKEYHEIVKKFDKGDIRSFINGHDFYDAFYRYTNCIKPSQKIKQEVLERTFFIALDYTTLDKHKLFITLRQVYS